MGPGVSMCLSLNYIHSGWSFSSFAYLQCAKIVHICSYPMRVFTESPNDITFLHIIICKPHKSQMDSLTLTSVYTYAMITICADSWNSRSVLWPMMFFGAAINRLEKKVTPRFSSDFSRKRQFGAGHPRTRFFLAARARRRRRPDADAAIRRRISIGE